MARKRKIIKFKNAIEIEEFHNGRYGAPGEKRLKKKKATPEQIEKRNQYNKEKLARWKLRHNFNLRDYYSCLTYIKEMRPESMKEAKKHFKRFYRKVREEYRKRGHELKWMRNIECGTKNAWHIHIVVNRIPDTDIILRQAWDKGGVHNQLLYEKGEFAELAAYMTKTPKTDKRLKEASYSTSKNLPVPEPKEEILWGKKWKEPQAWKGYYIDKNSLHEGKNPVTGHRYRCYTMIRINRRI